MPVPETTMKGERYVQVASRFFRVKSSAGAGVTSRQRLHYLESCFLCKDSIACNRDVFMYMDAAFCSDDCRQEQMDMDEALNAVARRHRLLSSSPAAEASRPPAMRRRPTIANLAARNHPVAAS
ncbi:unnamed protein product [Urochloa decumbens]|uniref:FLZ-type domain-containing protein n=1 Tax=Urochloa decumbens TaxID=240449 RepID=A0ABC9E3S7_9POAL